MEKGLRFRVNEPSVVYEKIDQEIVVINLDSGNYYSIEKVGADIWSCIPAGASESEIIEGMVGLYAGSHANIEGGVRNFLSELQEEGLIVPDETQADEGYKKPSNPNTMGSEREKISFEPPVLSIFTNMQEFLLVDPIHEIDYTGWPKQET